MTPGSRGSGRRSASCPPSRRQRFETEYGLSAYDANVLVEQGQDVADYYDAVAKATGEYKLASNWVQQDVLRTAKEKKITLAEFPVKPEALADLINRVKRKRAEHEPGARGPRQDDRDGRAGRRDHPAGGYGMVSDRDAIAAAVEAALAANPKAVEDLKGGKKKPEAVKGFLRGQVMKQTGGKADPALVGEVLDARLAEIVDAGLEEFQPRSQRQVEPALEGGFADHDRPQNVPEDRRRGARRLAAGRVPARRRPRASRPWRKAFMLGGVTQGPILPAVRAAEGGGLSRGRADQPERARPRRGPPGPRQDRADHPRRQRRRGTGRTRSPTPTPPSSSAAWPPSARRWTTARRTAARPSCSSRPWSTRTVSYRDAYKRSQANIRKLLPDAEKHGVKIAIEEVWNKFLLSPVEFARYIDEFDSPWVGAYFDVGNVVEYGYPQEWIRELGKRILKVHIKEYKPSPSGSTTNSAKGRSIGRRSARRSTDVGYEGWVTAEVGYGDVDHLEGRRATDGPGARVLTLGRRKGCKPLPPPEGSHFASLLAHLM